MKAICRPSSIFLSLILSVISSAQNGTWIWLKGSDTARAKPVFGVKGIPDINNTPGGIWGAGNWIDHEGNFWIFGGMYDTFAPNAIALVATSDLWKYDPKSNVWTWMSGPGVPNVPPVHGIQKIPSQSNNPAPLDGGYLCWTDKNDRLWLYGGNGSNLSNELWNYDISSNCWTWESGGPEEVYSRCVYGNLGESSASNTPGNRGGSNAAWVDKNGDLWLFGGGGSLGSTYDDMWKYNVDIGQWSWMHGPQGFGNTGNYGTKGVENSTNLPPPRIGFNSWKDNDDNFYIFSGFIGSETNVNYYNDVWQYKTTTNNWTWVAGDSGINLVGSYIGYCDTDSNFPSPRRYAGGLQSNSCTPLFYCFGGNTGNKLKNILNDLWVFNPRTNKWIWLSGSSQYNNLGNYGLIGLPAASNQIPARYGQCQWVDKFGVFWVFGGVGRDTIRNGYYPCCEIQTKNDLWKFIPDTSCVHMGCNTGSGSVDIYIPNAFSPNGDGVNDHFTVFGKNIVEYKIAVFNRWGEIVYSSHDVTELSDTTRGWDGVFKGRLLDPGVFTYTVTGRDATGQPFDRKGSVTLVR